MNGGKPVCGKAGFLRMRAKAVTTRTILRRAGILTLSVLLGVLVLHLGSTAGAQDQTIEKAVRFKDGTTVTGRILEMNIYTIKIQAADGAVVTRRFDDIAFIQNREEAAAPQSPLPVHSLEIGLEAYYKTYYEPDIMNEKGMMYGVRLAYAYHDRVMAGAQLLAATGTVSYDSNVAGSLDGITDQQWEVRGLLGYDFEVDPTFFVTPYFGLGYRYLGDDSSGKITSTNARGYNRQSNYWYSPVGVQIIKLLPGGWTIGASAEYDVFWSGTQKSYMSSVNPALPDVSNQQNQGYGLRGAVRVDKKFTYASLSVEPFIRYWNIGRSDNYYVSSSTYYYEPKNNTTECGVLVGLKF